MCSSDSWLIDRVVWIGQLVLVDIFHVFGVKGIRSFY